MKSKIRGFTLVEILIVVIILGILAAIVIPQFGTSTGDAKRSQVASSLSTLRAEIELFKSNHNDTPPDTTMLFTMLAGRSNTAVVNTTVATGVFGPYMQQPYIVNQLNGGSSVSVATNAGAGYGWYYTVSTANGVTVYTLDAIDTAGTTILPY